MEKTWFLAQNVLRRYFLVRKHTKIQKHIGYALDQNVITELTPKINW